MDAPSSRRSSRSHFYTPGFDNGHTIKWPTEKGTNNDLQNITQKTKNRATRTLLLDLEGLAVPAPHVRSVVLLVNDKDIIWYENRVGHQYTLINTNSINKTWTLSKQMRVETNRTSFCAEILFVLRVIICSCHGVRCGNLNVVYLWHICGVNVGGMWLVHLWVVYV
jgi:hypothetical protein